MDTITPFPVVASRETPGTGSVGSKRINEDADKYLHIWSFTCRISVSEVIVYMLNGLAILHMNTWSEKNAPLALLHVFVKGLRGDINWSGLIKDLWLEFRSRPVLQRKRTSHHKFP